jgi:hypothetical protein
MKNMKSSFNKIKNTIFYISIFLYQFAIYGQNIISIKNSVGNIIDFSIDLLLFSAIITLIMQKVSIKTWILCLSLLSLSILSYIIAEDNLLIVLATVIINCSNLKFSEIIKKDLLFKIIIFLLIYVSYSTGNTNELYFIRKGQVRYALGFNHPNTLGYFMLMLYMEYIYYKNTLIKNKVSNGIKKYLPYIVVNIVILHIMNVAHSRTSQICMIIYNIALIISTKKAQENDVKQKSRKKINTYPILYIAITIISFYSTALYESGSSIMYEINNIFSNRLNIQMEYLRLYDLNIIGRPMEYFTTLDNSYMHILINYGILAWIAYGLIFSKIFSKATSNKILKINMIILTIYGLMEWYTVRPILDIFILCVSANISNKGDKEDESTINLNNNSNI